MDAIILAGRANTGKLKEADGAANEALIPINGRPMVDYVVDALRGAGLKRIALVGPVRDLAVFYRQEEGLLLVEGGDTVMESTERGLHVLQPSGKVLVATGDIPFLTPHAVSGFLDSCTSEKVQMFYPIVAREAIEAAYPSAKRTYVRLKEGIFTGGNLFLVETSVITTCLQRGEDLFRLRKSPLALARAIGFVFIAKFLLRRLSVAEASRRVSRLLGVEGLALVCPFPEVGMDVDKPEDLEVARDILAAKGN